MNETENVPETIRLEAKSRALAILNSEPNCFSFVRPEDLETSALFIPVVSIIKPVVDDFHSSIPNIGILPKVPLQCLIREKSGTSIIRTEDGKRGEYVWTAHSYGERRGPDGTMEKVDGIYEFDAEKRAEEEFLKYPEKYPSETAKRKYVLGLCRFGQSKAVTGAQWIVTKKLAKIAGSFKTPQELMRGMKLVRYDRNINGVLADPNLRQAALGNMLGAKDAVFGPSTPPLAIEMKEDAPADAPARRYDPDTGEEIPQAATADTFEDDLPWKEEPAKPESTPLSAAQDALRAYLDQALPKNAVEEVRAVLNDNSATLEQVNKMVDRCSAYVQARNEKRASKKAGAA